MERGGIGCEETQHLLLLLPLPYSVTVGKRLCFLLSDTSVGKWRCHGLCPSFMSQRGKAESDNTNEAFGTHWEKTGV